MSIWAIYVFHWRTSRLDNIFDIRQRFRTGVVDIVVIHSFIVSAQPNTPWPMEHEPHKTRQNITKQRTGRSVGAEIPPERGEPHVESWRKIILRHQTRNANALSRWMPSNFLRPPFFIRLRVHCGPHCARSPILFPIVAGNMYVYVLYVHRASIIFFIL